MDTLIGPVPDGWRQVPLREIATIQAGPANITADLLPIGEDGIAVLTPGEIGWFGVTSDQVRTVSGDAAERLQRYRLHTGDLVCVRTGDLGRAARVGPEQHGWVLGTSCLRLRVTPPLDAEYVLRYLGHPQVRTWLQSNARYSTIPSLSTKVLGELPVVVAPPEVQATVVDVLGALEHKIVAHRALASECERMHAWLLPRLISGELPAQGQETDRPADRRWSPTLGQGRGRHSG